MGNVTGRTVDPCLEKTLDKVECSYNIRDRFHRRTNVWCIMTLPDNVWWRSNVWCIMTLRSNVTVRFYHCFFGVESYRYPITPCTQFKFHVIPIPTRLKHNQVITVIAGRAVRWLGVTALSFLATCFGYLLMEIWRSVSCKIILFSILELSILNLHILSSSYL